MSEQTKTAVKQGGMNTKVRYILHVTAMLSAVAFVLMYLEIAIPIMPSFIKFDFFGSAGTTWKLCARDQCVGY